MRANYCAVIAPRLPRLAVGRGGLVLPGEMAARASETLAYSGRLCLRHAINNSIRRSRTPWIMTGSTPKREGIRHAACRMPLGPAVSN